MKKFIVAGSRDYLESGVNCLVAHGYEPYIVLDRTKNPDDKIESYLDVIRKDSIELLICLAYPDILPKAVLENFSCGCINLHMGLPRYRGRHPLNWMLIDGVAEIPLSIHYMEEGIDTGDIIVETSIPVDRDETYLSALEKIKIAQSPLLIAAMRQINANATYRRKQNPGAMRYTKRRTPNDSAFKFHSPSKSIHRFINALVSPMPNAFSLLDDGTTVQFTRSFSGTQAGEVLARCEDGRYVIATEDGVVLVEINEKIALQGRRFV
jgi:methionyl-tRNA formyltransferase